MTAWKKRAGLAAVFVVTAGLGTGLGVVASERPTAADPAAAQAKPAEQKPETEARTADKKE